MTIQIQVNGTMQPVDTDANTPLLYALSWTIFEEV
jgi:hypothetical protein